MAFKCIYCSAINELNKFGTPPNSGPKLFLQSFQLVRVSGTGGGVSPPPQKKNSDSNYNNILFLSRPQTPIGLFVSVRIRL